jgi:hypothetical protein
LIKTVAIIPYFVFLSKNYVARIDNDLERLYN